MFIRKSAPIWFHCHWITGNKYILNIDIIDQLLAFYQAYLFKDVKKYEFPDTYKQSKCNIKKDVDYLEENKVFKYIKKEKLKLPYNTGYIKKATSYHFSYSIYD